MANIGLEITNRCNLECAMCGHQHMKRVQQDMPWEMFRQAVDEIRGRHRLQSMTFYGEPLLADNFVRAIRYLAKHNQRVENTFYTNATLLTADKVSELVDAGFLEVHSHTRKLWLALDTMDPKLYKRLRKGADFETVVTNIRRFIKVAKHLPGLGVQRLLTRWNPDEPEEPFKRFGVPVKTRIAGRHWVKNRGPSIVPFEEDRRPQCRELWGTCWVMSNGQAVSCCIDGEGEQPFGTYPEQSLKELARGRNRKAQQCEFKAGDYSNLALCARCKGDEPRGRV